MFEDPSIDVLTVCTSLMDSKPSVGIVFDLYLGPHNLCPVFELLEYEALYLLVLSSGFFLIITGFAFLF